MNYSHLDHYWKGTKEKHFSDFIEFSHQTSRMLRFRAEAIADEGFKTIRIPVCFSAWASLKKPYQWEASEGLVVLADLVEAAIANDLNVIIDLHHPELDGAFPDADSTDRLKWIWSEVAGSFKKFDPNRTFFEIRNEPHDVPAEAWREQANELIMTVRAIAPDHTLIVGFHDWNSRSALIGSEPFSDDNIIYTFHYYDPFLFTHQGATWSADGLADASGIPFPFDKRKPLTKPATVTGDWVTGLYRTYENDANVRKMETDLKAAKDWSSKNNVPIFLGEFGSFGKNIGIEDRCRHAKTVYSILGKLEIPNAWWEWDGGFTMSDKKSQRMSQCMREAVNSYSDPAKSKWSLTWSDEFNGPTMSPIDKSKWTAEIGGEGWGNKEFQYYTDSIENAYHDGKGSLAIMARELPQPSNKKCWYGDCKYTSARLVSKGKFAQKYGKFEARIRVPRGNGMWSAFWMLGDDFDKVGWPETGEIDIMENIGRELNKVYGTLHGPGYSGNEGIGKSLHRYKQYGLGYHVFTLEWEPEEIRWYIDGEHYQTKKPADLPKNAKWVYDHPFFLLLNLAVGGNWAQDPDPQTKFPQPMLVDYVRVYKKSPGN